MCVKIFRYWIIRAEIVEKRFLPDTVKTAKQDVKPTHPNCSIAIKNEIYSWPLFMIMTIFHVLDLLITEIMELTHLLLTLPFHIERSREINIINTSLLMKLAMEKHRTRLFNHIICNLFRNQNQDIYPLFYQMRIKKN